MAKIFSYAHFNRPSAIIEVSGDDAFTFLQGQFTNELRGETGRATYGLWLNQKGKVLADSYVLKHSETHFTLVSHTSPAIVISERLEQYIIADDVALSDDTGKKQGVTLWGTDVGEIVKSLTGSLPSSGQFLEGSGFLIFQGKRGGAETYEIIGPENVFDELKRKILAAGCIEADFDTLERARISSGIAAIPQDIGPTDLPNEAGLEKTTISFTKGCFLGQEVMARLKNLGQVRRELRRVHGTGVPPKKGELLFQGGKKIGEIRSAVSADSGFIAFAMLTRMGLDEKAGFQPEAIGQIQTEASIWMT